MIASAAAIFAIPAQANLTDSPFESNDGNLVVDGATGAQDWANAPNLEPLGIDPTNPDDSYKGGAKHDDSCPAAEFGGIPPNKDDLSRLYVAHDFINSQVFLYVAWERLLSKESSASAHMGIEFNQHTVPCGAPSKNVVRTANDILILYDLEGGGQPNLILLKWLTPTTGGLCKAAAAPPCWGNEFNLSTAGFADGEINRSAPITDPLSNLTLNFTNQFGEAAINLTAANAFPAGQCTGFGRATLGSRSSGNSFVSTQKDFLGPIPVNINICQPATFNVLKVDDADTPIPGIGFELYEDNGTTPNALDAGDTLKDSCTTGAAGTCSLTVTSSGTHTYIIHEVASTVPAGYDVAPDQVRTVTFGTASQTIPLTFRDPRKHRVIVIVCHEGSNTLAKSNVTRGAVDKFTLAHNATLPGSLTESQLCGIGGASFGGISGHPLNDQLLVDIASDAH